MYVDHSQFATTNPKLADARRQLRQRVSAPVEIHAPAFGHFGGRLIDLSVDGCRIATGTRFAPGTPLTIAIAGGFPVPATIIWSHGEESGLRFGAIDHRAIVEQLLKVLGD